MRQRWNTPAYTFVLGAALSILAMLAVTRVNLPDHLWPAPGTGSVAPPQVTDRIPDALGASLARSLADSGHRALRSLATPDTRLACEAAIAGADGAAFRAAEDARGRQYNAQNMAMVVAAEDLYLDAARLCVREARPVCQANPRRIDGCDQVLSVREGELASIRALRVNRNN